MLPTTIRVFEHERLAVGQTREAVGGGVWRFDQRDFDALAGFVEATGSRLVELGHRSVRFQNYVGYLQVGALGIEVLPKADRQGPAGATPWRDALLDMLRVASGVRLVHPTDANQELRSWTLLDVYIDRFLSLVEALLHRGLVRGYRRVQENRPAFRGRLVVAENVRRNLVRAQMSFVEHQVYDHDVLANRVLFAALEVLGRASLRSSTRARVRRVSEGFPLCVRGEVAEEQLARLTLSRNARHYEEAVLLARLILLGRAPNLRAGAAPVLALMFDMNLLWERFVAVTLQRVAPTGLRVSTQSSRAFWKGSGGRGRTVKPDILVHAEGVARPEMVLDTKWKLPKRGKPSDADLKQMFVYNELYDAPRSLLVYPAGRGLRDDGGRFSRRRHECGVRFVRLFEGGRYDAKTARGEIARLLDATRRSR